MVKNLIVLIAAVMLVASPAVAEKVGGVNLDETLQAGKDNLVLNGAGIRKKAFLKIYVGGLYLKEKNKSSESIINADEPMAIRLCMVSGMITPKKMLSATEEGFQNATNGNTAPIQNEINAFNKCFDKIEKKDVFDIVYVPAQGVTVSRNGKPQGTIKGLEFKKALFGIWLCDKPADKKLKNGMLGI